MKPVPYLIKPFLLLLVCLLLSGYSQLLQAQVKAGDKTITNKADTMAQLLDLSRPNTNHLHLSAIEGNWNFQDAKLAFVKGTLSRKPIYDGRFYMVEITGGRLPLPVADGKMKEDNYKSMQTEGYDNGRMEFVTSSINNHIGSDIQLQTGTYDSASKTFTYHWESELLRGVVVKKQTHTQDR